MERSIVRRASLPRLRPTTLPALLLLVVLAAVALALGRLVPLAADDFGIAGLYSTDEELASAIVWQMLDQRTLSPDHFFAYGALYHEAGALVALPAALDGLSQRDVLVALRLVSLAGGLATLVLTYLLGRSLFGAWAGVLAAALLALSSELATWSVTAHPDTLQLALLCGTLLVCAALVQRYRTRTLLLAVLLAGLVFATKYLGLFLLPLIALAALAGLARTGPWGRSALNQLARDGALAAGVFAGTFLATNPYALIEWRRFLTQFQNEVAHARAGHVFVEAGSRWEWLSVIASTSFLPGAVAVLASVTVLVATLGIVRQAPTGSDSTWVRASLKRVDGRVLLILWTGAYLAYLIAQIRYHAPRHALPLAPGLAVLAAGSLTMPRHGGVRATAALAFALVAVITAAGPLGDLVAERRARPAQLDTDPRVEAGRWLAATYAPQTAILRDAYAYVPSGFSQVSTTFGLTAGQLATIRPDVVVVNEAIRGRYRDPGGGERYVDGEAAYRERAAAYASLEQLGESCYILRRSFENVQIYEHQRLAADQVPVPSAMAAACGQ